MDKNNSRRKFLRNTALSALSLGAITNLAQAKPSKEEQLDSCDPTTLDYYGEGPFYTANPPQISNNKLASNSEPGTKLVISGRVFNLDCSQLVPNAVIDVWHANDSGAYDNTGYNLRGQTTSNNQGFYIFETIKPGLYLNGPTYRPSHIHFKITAPNFSTLTTQLYFQGDPYIANDAAASQNSGTYDASNRIIPLTNNAGTLEGTWDIVVNGTGIPNGIGDIHLDKGIIYSASPNPCIEKLRIYYGVFREAKVSINIFNVSGQTVATLDESNHSPEKYEVFWEPEAKLPNGHYFVALKMNDLQVHYTKIVLSR